jgi:hypothetical protein
MIQIMIEEFPLTFDHFMKASGLLAMMRTERWSDASVDTPKKRGTEEGQSTSDKTVGGGQANARRYDGICTWVACVVTFVTRRALMNAHKMAEVVADYAEQVMDKQPGIRGKWGNDKKNCFSPDDPMAHSCGHHLCRASLSH